MTPEQRKASFAELLGRYHSSVLRAADGKPQATMESMHLMNQVLAAFYGLSDLYDDAVREGNAHLGFLKSAKTPATTPTPPPGWHSHQCGHAGCSMVWYGPGTQRDGDRCEMHAGQP